MIPTHTHTSLYVLAWAVVCRRVSAIHGKTKELALTHTHHEIAHVCAFPVCVSMRHKQAPECYDSSSTHTQTHTQRDTQRQRQRQREARVHLRWMVWPGVADCIPQRVV